MLTAREAKHVVYVPPAENDCAYKLLQELEKRWPDGFNFRYEEVDGLGHGPPKKGYMPSQPINLYDGDEQS